jgi:hypothetical protein
VRMLRERQEVAARQSHLASGFTRGQLAILRALGDVRRSLPQVAEQVGCSPSHVWQVLRLARSRLMELAKAGRLARAAKTARIPQQLGLGANRLIPYDGSADVTVQPGAKWRSAWSRSARSCPRWEPLWPRWPWLAAHSRKRG